MFTQNYLGNDLSNIFLDDTDSFGNDEFLGIGKRDKVKKGQKKIAKAQKQLSKGHIKAAERKIKKGSAILSKAQATQQSILGAQGQIKDINATKSVIDAANVRQTESPITTPGQIGTEAGSTTTTAAGAGGGIGGGAGGVDTNDTTDTSGDFAVDEKGNIIDKQLPGVTVGGKKKTNWLLIAGIVVAAIVLYFVIIKFSKPKS